MPETLRLDGTSAVEIARAAALLRDGGTVAFPTETVYGLGANALSAQAVAKIFEAKQRPSWDPLIVHVAEVIQLAAITRLEVELIERVEMLSRAFWPGPLTLLLPRSSVVPDAITAGRHLVGVRVLAHPIARALLEAAGIPVAAPSANTFGHISPTTAAHVLADLDGRIDAVLDGGPTQVGLESTVLDPGETPMVLYRPGAVTVQAIMAATGLPVEVFQPVTQMEPAKPEALPSPGVGIRHYAPQATVILCEGSESALRQTLSAATSTAPRRTGVLLPLGWTTDVEAVIEPWAHWDDPEALAARLFSGMRSLDDRGVTRIVCPMPAPGGLNDAIRDRLTKAARNE